MYGFQDLAVSAAIHFCFIATVNPERLESLSNLRWYTPKMWSDAMTRNQKYYDDRALYQHDPVERYEQILSKLCLLMDAPDEATPISHCEDLLYLLQDIIDAIDAAERNDFRL